MAYQTIQINCPGCGAPVSTDQKECDWCHGPVIISTFNSVYSMPLPEVNKRAMGYGAAIAQNPDHKGLYGSMAMCYLKLGLYDKALAAFDKAIENNFDNSEMYFYASICLLKGQKPFLHLRPTIDKILEYMNAATMIEPKGIYYYFMAYIKQDYFARKYLITSPKYNELLATAKQYGYSDFDVQQLFSILKTEIPAALA